MQFLRDAMFGESSLPHRYCYLRVPEFAIPLAESNMLLVPCGWATNSKSRREKLG
jgi:hypothetical protein